MADKSAILQALAKWVNQRPGLEFGNYGDKVSIDYCVGQYWPTEYRRAVCALLSSVIWAWLRENAPVDAGPTIAHSNLQDIGGWIRKQSTRELGRSIAQRWFN